MTTPPDNPGLTPEQRAVVQEAIEAAFGLLELVKTTGGDLPVQVPEAYDRLLELTAKHGGGALGAVWMIWGKLIALGLGDDTPTAALYPNVDGNPDLRYARSAVTIARQADAEGMAQLVDAVFRDQQARRTGACIENTCAFLLTGASQYGKFTNDEPARPE